MMMRVPTVRIVVQLAVDDAERFACASLQEQEDQQQDRVQRAAADVASRSGSPTSYVYRPR